MLVRCLYASRTKADQSAEILTQILESSRKHNPQRGITGVLLTTNLYFVQLLEGGRDEVNQLYNSIVRDERHHEVRMLVYEEITERRFESWSMGKVNMDRVNPGMLLKYSPKADLDPMNCSGQAMLSLISDLVATGSIIQR